MKISSELSKAIEILKKGGVVVYPTDTAYGMAVDAANLKAVNRLYRLKGRDFKKPIHVIPPSKSYIGLFARISLPEKKLIDKFLPGPLTIIVKLKIKSKSWQRLSAGTGTIGVRIPDHQTAHMLVEAFGKPITATSANVSGKPTTYSVVEVRKQFEKSKLKPDFYLDGGKLKKIKPSTIVAIVNNNVKIIRQGPIVEKEIKRSIKGLA